MSFFTVRFNDLKYILMSPAWKFSTTRRRRMEVYLWGGGGGEYTWGNLTNEGGTQWRKTPSSPLCPTLGHSTWVFRGSQQDYGPFAHSGNLLVNTHFICFPFLCYFLTSFPHAHLRDAPTYTPQSLLFKEAKVRPSIFRTYVAFYIPIWHEFKWGKRTYVKFIGRNDEPSKGWETCFKDFFKSLSLSIRYGKEHTKIPLSSDCCYSLTMKDQISLLTFLRSKVKTEPFGDPFIEWIKSLIPSFPSICLPCGRCDILAKAKNKAKWFI